MSSPASKPASPIIKSYLIGYNLLCCAGWAYVLVLALQAINQHKDSSKQSIYQSIYAAVEKPLQFVQTLAVLEVVHSLIRIVRTPVMSTVLQVTSRLFIVWGILFLSKESQHSLGMALAVISWSLVEVPRYLFYTVGQISTPPAWLTWLRYSLFAILYPTGITGEILSTLAAIPLLNSNPQLWSITMPNQYNFSFSYLWLVYLALATYVPGSPFMFMHMVKQRSKVLGAARVKQA